MAKSVVSVAAALLLVLVAVPAAVAVTYRVGDSSRWNSGVDYTSWITGKTFRVGDTLEFLYGSSHSVDAVDKDGYDNCDSSKASQRLSGGDTKVELRTAGPMYFICPTSGHCEGGMKLAINVQASTTPTTPATPSPPSTTPSPPGSSGSPPATGTPAAGSRPPPPRPNAASRGLVSYAMIGASVVLGSWVWIMG